MQTRQRIVQPVVNGQAAAPYTHGKAGTAAAHVEEETSTSKPVVLGAVMSTASLVLYLLSSSYIILLNKRLMVDDGFKYPLALTGLAQLAGAVAGVAYKASSLVMLSHCACLSSINLRCAPSCIRYATIQDGLLQSWDLLSWGLRQHLAFWPRACSPLC